MFCHDLKKNDYFDALTNTLKHAILIVSMLFSNKLITVFFCKIIYIYNIKVKKKHM